MRRIYKLLARLGDRLARLDSDAGAQLWTRANARKPTKCSICGERIEKGLGCWRPLTNGQNRYERIDDRCILDMELAHAAKAARS